MGSHVGRSLSVKRAPFRVTVAIGEKFTFPAPNTTDVHGGYHLAWLVCVDVAPPRNIVGFYADMACSRNSFMSTLRHMVVRTSRNDFLLFFSFWCFIWRKQIGVSIGI